MSDVFKILIVDDEESVLRSLQRLFRNQSYDVSVFTSPIEAIEAVQKTAFDLMISDMQMPEMDGAAFLSKAKELRPSSVRMLLTGHSCMEATVRAINEGEIFAYVTKPWDNEEFQSLVEEALSKRKKEKIKNKALHTLKKMHDSAAEDKEAAERRLEQKGQESRIHKQALTDTYALIEESFINLLDMKQSGQRAFAYHLEEVILKVVEGLKDDELFNLQAEDRNLLKLAAHLHGIGKIGVPDHLLTKTLDQMNEDEQHIYMGYPANSACTLIAIEAFSGVSDILFKQKERLDQTGYPMQIDKQDFTPANKVFNAALEYCEYRYSPSQVPLSHEQAIEKMNAQAGAYAPKVLRQLAKLELERNLVPSASDSMQLPVHSLEPGMVVKDDIYTENDLLLLRAGAFVNEALIERLANMERSMNEPVLVTVLLDQPE